MYVKLFELTNETWSIYVCTIGIVFFILKTMNYCLNRLFDLNKIKKEEITITGENNETDEDMVLRLVKKSEPKIRRLNINNINRNLSSGISSIITNESDDSKQQTASSITTVISNTSNHNNPNNSPTNRSLFKISEESLNQATESTLTATERVSSSSSYRLRTNRRLKSSSKRKHIRSDNQLVTPQNQSMVIQEPEYTQVQSDTKLFIKQHHRHSDSDDDDDNDEDDETDQIINESENELVKVRRTNSDFTKRHDLLINNEQRSKSYHYLFNNNEREQHQIQQQQQNEQLNNELKEAFEFLFNDENRINQVEDEEDIIQLPREEMRAKEPKIKVKHYLTLGNSKIPILFDHYTLISMFDRNESLFECFVHLVLAFLTSIMTSILIIQDYFGDDPLCFVLLIFVQSGCLYSLIKSCQPDASSSTHGFNRITCLSRPIYYVLFCFGLLSVDYALYKNVQFPISFYQFEIHSNNVLLVLKQAFKYSILALPLFHTIGMFAQIDVFIHALTEQIDIHVFGATASTNLINSLLSLIQSLVTIGFLASFLLIIRPNQDNFHRLPEFSLYCSLLITFSFILSRKSNDFELYVKFTRHIYKLLQNFYKNLTENISNEQEEPSQPKLSNDPLTDQLFNSFKIRFESDFIQAIFLFAVIFSLHSSTLFIVLNQSHNTLNLMFVSMAICLSWLNNYLLLTLRLEKPWFLFSKPLIVNKKWYVNENGKECESKIFWYEKFYTVVNFIIKNIINPLYILGVLSVDFEKLIVKFGPIVVTLFAVKLLRTSYCQPYRQYKVYLVALLLQLSSINESQLTNLFFISILIPKLDDFLKKIDFFYKYTAPWQLSWGSAFHAFAQPLSLPHSVLLLIQSLISSLINAPLMPVMGSAFFMLSYMRPTKFWNNNASNKKKIEQEDSTLKKQLLDDPIPSSLTGDSENFNAIFYEHLSIVLQKSLYGDLTLGRWGHVDNDNFFILSSDYLNCLVHIIEIGNGFVLFQLRGLEFKGTYCQQRELEAITEDPTLSTTTSPILIKLSNFFTLRWYAWHLVSKKYVVDAYRIVDNDMSLIINFFSLKRTLIDYYVKSAIYYLLTNAKIESILKNTQLINELKSSKIEMDADKCFDSNLDCDYDTNAKAITYAKFQTIYRKWIDYCASKKSLDVLVDHSLLVKFCFYLSLACKRALMTACNHGKSDFSVDNAHYQHQSSILSSITGSSIEVPGSFSSSNPTGTSNLLHEHETLSSFQHGFYTLFKGDVRISSTKDEWIYLEPDLIPNVITPSIRMALRLHQDHFQVDNQDDSSLFESITRYNQESIITYERDPLWRQGILNNIDSLLALRHQFTEFSDQYKVIMLNKNNLNFRLIKLNKECVKSFWAGQQHELVFLRNKNQERGSIQNAKQVLRNIINSSCDQPIGYPIYVSPLITSYSTTSNHSLINTEYTFYGIYSTFKKLFNRIKNNCLNNCTGSHHQSGLSEFDEQQQSQNDIIQLRSMVIPTSDTLSLTTYKPRPSTADSLKVLKDVSSINSSTQNSKNGSVKCITIEKVEITDISKIVDPKLIDSLKQEDLQMHDNDEWKPSNGMEGIIVRRYCSNDYKSIVQISILDKYTVFIDEKGLRVIQESTML